MTGVREDSALAAMLGPLVQRELADLRIRTASLLERVECLEERRAAGPGQPAGADE